MTSVQTTKKTALTWPWQDAFDAAGFFIGGDLYDVAGHTGEGKSRIMMRLVRHFVSADKAAGLYFGTEMTADELLIRLFIEQDGRGLSENWLKAEAWHLLPDGTEQALAHFKVRWQQSGAGKRLVFHDEVCPSLTTVEKMMYAYKGRARFIVLDHIGQFVFPGRGLAHEREKEAVSRLKQVARDCDMVVFAVVQQKGVEAHNSRAESLRGSAAWSHAASGIIEAKKPVYLLDASQRAAFLSAVERGDLDADAAKDGERLNLRIIKSRDTKGKGKTLCYAWEGNSLVPCTSLHLAAAEQRRQEFLSTLAVPTIPAVDRELAAQAAAEREARRKERVREQAQAWQRRNAGDVVPGDVDDVEVLRLKVKQAQADAKRSVAEATKAAESRARTEVFAAMKRVHRKGAAGTGA